MAEKFYTTGEAANAIGVSRQTLQTWIAEGKVGAPKIIGNTRVWPESHVKQLKGMNRKKRGHKPKGKN